MTANNIFRMVPIETATSDLGTIFISDKRVEIVGLEEHQLTEEERLISPGEIMKTAKLDFITPFYLMEEPGGVLLSKEEYNHLIGQAILAEQLEEANATLLGMINGMNRKIEALA